MLYTLPAYIISLFSSLFELAKICLPALPFSVATLGPVKGFS
jgi:hypothetical protein